jgi:hypothetical protein
MTIRMTSLRRSAATVALTGALALGLAACSNGDSGSDASSSPTASATATASQTPKPTQTTAAPDAAADGDVAAFCQLTEAMSTMDQAAMMADPAAAVAQFNDFAVQFKSITPPAEVAGDVSVLATALESYVANLQSALDNPTAADAATKASEAVAALTDPAVMEASANISAYAATNCS